MARKFWFNVLATLLGLAGEGIGFWLGELLLVDVLGNIPIIPKLLSWPGDYRIIYFLWGLSERKTLRVSKHQI